jgi:hypothetical protein
LTNTPPLPACLWVLLALSLLLGCSEDSRPAHEVSPREIAATSTPDDPALAERAKDPRPSVLLIVIDTLRADAVSAYGAVEGTTPNFDALAARGVLYRNAFSPAPWTVSSHASLFSGLQIDQHGVGLSYGSTASESLSMLAESFADAGYVTAGFSENPLVGPLFGLDQGFEHFEVEITFNAQTMDEAEFARHKADENSFGLVGRVSAWAANRDRSRPYFVFINIFDAHGPYLLRTENPWVSASVDPRDLRYVAETYRVVAHALCGAVPSEEDVKILRGLYLGDVAAADAKLGELVERSRNWEGSKSPITVATSDHGEHFGEHRLMNHLYSLRSQTLHVPMVISGVEGGTSGIVESSVGLLDVGAALRCWALKEDCDSNWPLPGQTEGRPVEPKSASPPLFSFYSDATAMMPKAVLDNWTVPEGYEWVNRHRDSCGPEDRVFGEMASMIRYPMKINWVEDQPFEVYDLSWDPEERSNLVEVQVEKAAELRAELEKHLEERIIDRDRPSDAGLSDEQLRALKSLGYIE